MAWQVSPVQNSEMVLYCRLIRLKNVVAVGQRQSCGHWKASSAAAKREQRKKKNKQAAQLCGVEEKKKRTKARCGSGPLRAQGAALHLSLGYV